MGLEVESSSSLSESLKTWLRVVIIVGEYCVEGDAFAVGAAFVYVCRGVTFSDNVDAPFSFVDGGEFCCGEAIVSSIIFVIISLIGEEYAADAMRLLLQCDSCGCHFAAADDIIGIVLDVNAMNIRGVLSSS